jgi:hypothetical protein
MNVESWAVRLRWTKDKSAEYVVRASGEGEKGNVLAFDAAAFDLPSEDALLDFSLEIVSANGEIAKYRFADLYALSAVPATWVGYKGYSRPDILTSIMISLPSDTEVTEIRFLFDRTEHGTILLDNVAVREEVLK